MNLIVTLTDQIKHFVKHNMVKFKVETNLLSCSVPQMTCLISNSSYAQNMQVSSKFTKHMFISTFRFSLLNILEQT